MPEKVRVHLWISGRVQGVCFRAETEQEALRRGLTGWVRNGSDGKVEAIFEGDPTRIEEMISWCHQGPPAARVTHVQIEWEIYRGNFPDFRVISSY